MDKVILKGFPIPPTTNKSQASFNGRLIKTEAVRLWENKTVVWKLRNGAKIQELYHYYNEIYKGPIQVDLAIVFYKPRIIRKDGLIKERKLDATNFVKSSLDAIAKAIGVDDARFNTSKIERVISDSESDEQILVSIYPCEIGIFKNGVINYIALK